MLSFDQYHFTFHNLMEQRYVCNYFSGDGAKERFQSIYACRFSVKNWHMLSNNTSGTSSHQYFKRNSVTSCFRENI